MRLRATVTIFLNTLMLCCIAPGYSFAQEDSLKLNNKAAADNLYYDAVKAQMLGDNHQSEALFQEVIKKNPQEGAAWYNLSRLAVSANKADKATEYIKKALALDADNKWYREQFASVLVMRNQMTEAAEEFSKLAKSEKYNEAYLRKSAALYQRAGKNKEALSALEQLEKKDPSEEEYTNLQQEIYLKMNDVPGAVGVAQRVIDRSPKEAKNYTRLAEIYENNKQREKAEDVFKTMQQKFPNDPSTQLSLANQYLRKGDTAQYRAYVHKAITNSELDAELQSSLLIKYLQEIGSDSLQKKEALSLTEKIVTQHADDANIISLYGDVLRMNNMQDKGIEQYKKVVVINPASWPAWQQLLGSYSDPRDADSLIKYSDKAARLFPNQAMVHYMNGIGYYNKKNNINAVRAINRAIDLQSDEGPEAKEELGSMYSLRGDILNTLKEYKQSDSSFEMALAMTPRNATVLNNYAYYLSVRNQRLSDAERMSKKSLEIRPGEGTFLDTYGWILYQQGKFDKALEYIKQAISTAKETADGTLFEHLGAVYFKLGDTAKAVEAWKNAKQKGAENPNLDKMIAEKKLYE